MAILGLAKRETCLQYLRRRLSEGWKCISLEGYNAVLLSPEGFRRELDLGNDIETLRPDAAGDEESMSYATSGAGNHHLDVDEETADEGITFVRNNQVTSYQRDLYNLPASSGSGSINFIKIYFRVARTTGSAWAKPSLKSNSTVTDGTEISIAADFTTHSEQWNTNPADGAWEWADIDDLQIGISLKSEGVTYVYCTQVYVEVDYTPPAVVEYPIMHKKADGTELPLIYKKADGAELPLLYKRS